MFDLAPGTQALAAVVAGITDDQLDGLTPCEGMSVADLLDHVDGLALAFSTAATKTASTVADQASQPDGARLTPAWRSQIPGRFAELAAAWRDEPAWSGMTRAGGVEMPGEVAALVATGEVIVHGWDLAVATGQPFAPQPALVAAAAEFVRASVAESPQGTPGLFGPPVVVADGAPELDQLIGLTGRDPGWRRQ